MASKTPCSDQTFISTVEECKHAAQILGIPYGVSGEWRYEWDFVGCFAAMDGRNKVFFNTAMDLSTTTDDMHPKYHAICNGKINTDTNNGQVVPIKNRYPLKRVKTFFLTSND